MKESIKEFRIPKGVLEYLKLYERFRIKKFVGTIENKFYVGEEVSFSGTQKLECFGNGYNKPLDRIVHGDVEYVRFRGVNDNFRKEFITIIQSVEDLLKQFEPIIVKEEDFKFKLKLGKLEIIFKK